MRAVVSMAVLFAAGCRGGQEVTSVVPTPSPATPGGPTAPISTIRVITPISNTVIPDRDQPVQLTVMLGAPTPTDYTVEVAESGSFTTILATVRVQLTPGQQTSIPLPVLDPDRWYIWRIRPTLVDEGRFASSATFRIGPKI